MAIKRWVGQAQPVPAVAQFVPASVEPGCEFVMTSGTKSVSYRYAEIQPPLQNLAIERQQTVVDELVALLATADFTEGDEPLTFESDSLNGNPSIRVVGGSKGQPITLQSTAVSPTAAAIRITRVQEGTAGTDYVFTLKFPATPNIGSWGITANGKDVKMLAYNATTSAVQTAIAALGLPCTSVAVSGSYTAGYTVTLSGLLYPLDYPPVEITNGNIGATSTGFGYTVEQIGSVGVVNQESYLPVLDGSTNTMYRFKLGDRYSHYFTGAATTSEIADAAKSLFGTANVTVSEYTREPEYQAILEFHGIYAGIDVDVELEVDDTATDLPIKTEAGGAYTGKYVQRFRFASGATGGTFAISDGTNLTNITWNSSVATINMALSSASIPATCIAANAEYFDIETSNQVGVYLGTQGITIVGPTVEVTSEGRPKQPEIQLVALANKPTGGTFTLTYGANTTTAIAHNASAATVESALNAIASIGAGGVSVLGGNGGPYRVKWTTDAARTMMTATSSLTLAVSPTFTRTDIVAGTGPHHFDNAANWSTGTIPADNDIIVFKDGAIDCRYNLSQSAITPLSVDVYKSFTGTIGLPEVRADGSRETLARYLRLGNAADGVSSTNVNIGLGEEGTGEGPSVVRLDFGDQPINAFVRYSQFGSTNRCVSVIGTAATNKAYVTLGDVAFGLYPDDSVTLAELHLLPEASEQSGDSLRVTTGDGATISMLMQQGGVVELAKPASYITVLGGVCTVSGTGKPNTVEVANGNVIWRSSGDLGKSGTISAVSISSGVATVTSNGHGLASGDRVYIRGVGGITGLDGRTFAVEVTSVNAFKLIGSNCSGSYSSGVAWGLAPAIIVRGGGVLDFSQDARTRDLVAPVLLQSDGQILDPRMTVSDLRWWPEQVPSVEMLGRSMELRRATR